MVIDHFQTVDHQGVISPPDAIADQFQKACIDHLIGGHGPKTVMGRNDRGRIRPLGVDNAQIIGVVSQGPATDCGSAFQAVRVSLGGLAVELGAVRLAKSRRKVGGQSKPGDFRRHCRGGIARLFLPPFHLSGRGMDHPMIGPQPHLAALHQKISRGPQRPCPRPLKLDIADQAKVVELPGQHDGHSGLVHLNAKPFGRAVHMGLLLEPTADRVRFCRHLHRLEITESCDGRLGVAERRQGHGALIKVTRPDRLIAGRGLGGADRIAPRVGQRRDQSAGIGLVFLDLQGERTGKGELTAVGRLRRQTRQLA